MAWKMNSAKRRALVKLQLRDRHGRWIEMGGGVKWYSSKRKKTIGGTVVGSQGSYALVRLNKENPTHEPELVKVQARSIEVVDSKATLSTPNKGNENTPAPQASAPNEEQDVPQRDNGSVTELPQQSDAPEDYKISETSDGNTYISRADGEQLYFPARGLRAGDEILAPEGADPNKPFSIGQGWATKGAERLNKSGGPLIGKVLSVDGDRYAVVQLPEGHTVIDRHTGEPSDLVSVGLSNRVIKATPGLKAALGDKLNDSNFPEASDANEEHVDESDPAASASDHVGRELPADQQDAQPSDFGKDQPTLAAFKPRGKVLDEIENAVNQSESDTGISMDGPVAKVHNIDAALNTIRGLQSNAADKEANGATPEEKRSGKSLNRSYTKMVDSLESKRPAASPAPEQKDSEKKLTDVSVEEMSKMPVGTVLRDPNGNLAFFVKEDGDNWAHHLSNGTPSGNVSTSASVKAADTFNNHTFAAPGTKPNDRADAPQSAPETPNAPEDQSAPASPVEDAPAAPEATPAPDAPAQEAPVAPEASKNAPEAPQEDPAPEAPAPEADAPAEPTSQATPVEKITEGLDKLEQIVDDVVEANMSPEEAKSELADARFDITADDGKKYTISAVLDENNEYAFTATGEDGGKLDGAYPVGIGENSDTASKLLADIKDASGTDSQAPSEQAAPVADAPATPEAEQYDENGLTPSEAKEAAAAMRMATRAYDRFDDAAGDRYAAMADAYMKRGAERKASAPDTEAPAEKSPEPAAPAPAQEPVKAPESAPQPEAAPEVAPAPESAPQDAPITGPSAAEKIANAEKMYGTGSPQHQQAQDRWGAEAASEAKSAEDQPTETPTDAAPATDLGQVRFERQASGLEQAVVDAPELMTPAEKAEFDRLNNSLAMAQHNNHSVRERIAREDLGKLVDRVNNRISNDSNAPDAVDPAEAPTTPEAPATPEPVQTNQISGKAVTNPDGTTDIRTANDSPRDISEAEKRDRQEAQDEQQQVDENGEPPAQEKVDPISDEQAGRVLKTLTSDNPLPEGVERHVPEAVEGESFPPTQQQQDVIDAVLGGLNTLVQAKAGAGKTSTLRAIARRLKIARPDDKVGYIAFNKTVQLEANASMPNNVEARTGHSVAYKWSPDWMKARTNDPNPVRRPGDVARHLGIYDPMTVDGKAFSPTDQAMAVTRAVDTFANSAEDVVGREHLPESVKGMPEEVQDHIVNKAQEAWADLTSETGRMRMTLDHMRKQWALSRPDFSQPGSGLSRPVNVLFLDEAQDTPPVLAKVIADQTVQKVIVGDADQAIYGFTGATDYLSNAEGDVELPLNKSWRFGPEVADMGNRFLQLLKSPGRVVGGGPSSEIVHGMRDADAVLVRSNGGMLGEIAKELEAGRTVGVPKGTKKDLESLLEAARYLRGEGGAPTKMHDDLAPFRTYAEFVKEESKGDDPTLSKIKRMIDTYGLDGMEDLISRVVETGDAGLEGVAFEDHAAGLIAGGNTWGVASMTPRGERTHFSTAGFRYMDHPDGVRVTAGRNRGQIQKVWVATGTPDQRERKLAKLRELTSGPTPDVVISTAHKSKGLEWGRVRIGDDFFAPKLDDNGEITEMPKPEELRLAYVAVTRAEKELDPGSLGWVVDLTDKNGGVPEGPSGSNEPDAPSAPDASKKDVPSEDSAPTKEKASEPKPKPKIEDPIEEPSDEPAAPIEEPKVPDINEDGLTPSEQAYFDALNERLAGVFSGTNSEDQQPLEAEIDAILAHGDRRAGGRDMPEYTPTIPPTAEVAEATQDDVPDAPAPKEAVAIPTGKRPRSTYNGDTVMDSTGAAITTGDMVGHRTHGPVMVTGVLGRSQRIKFINPVTGLESSVGSHLVTRIDPNGPKAPQAKEDIPTTPGGMFVDPATGKKGFIDQNGNRVLVGDEVISRDGRTGIVKGRYQGADGLASIAIDFGDGRRPYPRIKGALLQKADAPKLVQPDQKPTPDVVPDSAPEAPQAPEVTPEVAPAPEAPQAPVSTPEPISMPEEVPPTVTPEPYDVIQSNPSTPEPAPEVAPATEAPAEAPATDSASNLVPSSRHEAVQALGLAPVGTTVTSSASSMQWQKIDANMWQNMTFNTTLNNVEMAAMTTFDDTQFTMTHPSGDVPSAPSVNESLNHADPDVRLAALQSAPEGARLRSTTYSFVKEGDMWKNAWGSVYTTPEMIDVTGPYSAFGGDWRLTDARGVLIDNPVPEVSGTSTPEAPVASWPTQPHLDSDKRYEEVMSLPVGSVISTGPNFAFEKQANGEFMDISDGRRGRSYAPRILSDLADRSLDSRWKYEVPADAPAPEAPSTPEAAAPAVPSAPAKPEVRKFPTNIEVGSFMPSQPQSRSGLKKVGDGKWEMMVDGKPTGRFVDENAANVIFDLTQPKIVDPVPDYGLSDFGGEGKTFGDFLKDSHTESTSVWSTGYGSNVEMTMAQKRKIGAAYNKFVEQINKKLPAGFSARLSSNPTYYQGGRFSTTIRFYKDGQYDSIGYAQREFGVENIFGKKRAKVYHAFFELDRDVQGSGINNAFLKESLALYDQLGLDAVRVTANIDVGGYTWARSGFNFLNLSSLTNTISQMEYRLRVGRQTEFRDMPQAKWDEIMAKFEEYKSKATQENFDAGTAPSAFQLSQLGYDPSTMSRGRDSMWPGKRAMLGLNWSGVRAIDAERDLRVDEAQ